MPKKRLPLSSTPQVEVYCVKMFPSAFLNSAHSQSYRDYVLEKLEKIRDLIQKFAYNSKQQSQNEMTANCYTAFTKPIANSIYDFGNALAYGGFTEDSKTYNRIITYASLIEKLLNNPAEFLAEKSKSINQPFIQHLAENWISGSENFIQFITEHRWLSRAEALFIEHAVISVLRWLPVNFNNNHGSTTSYKTVLSQYNVSEETVLEIGCVELSMHYNRIKHDLDFATPICTTSNQHVRTIASETPKHLL